MSIGSLIAVDDALHLDGLAAAARSLGKVAPARDWIDVSLGCALDHAVRAEALTREEADALLSVRRLAGLNEARTYLRKLRPEVEERDG